ncbi:MAG: helix-turn-helix domain-containing protein [Nitrospinae bacterium]|nr:helix-turn-helix domain-containing protein [Nitrospinota bacterium]
MESIGQYLKTNREAKGATLEEIAKATHINKRFLLAIEHEDFKKLPGEIFVKGFIKTYAQYIGLDPTEVLETYHDRFEKKEPEKVAETEIKYEAIPVESGVKPNKFWLAFVAFLVVVGVSYYFSEYSKRSRNVHQEQGEGMPISAPDSTETPDLKESGPVVLSERPAQKAVIEEGEAKDEAASAGVAPGKPDKKEELVDASAGKKPAAEDSVPLPPKNPLEVPVAGELLLKLAASTDSWLSVKIDGETMKRNLILRAGDTATFKATKDFSISTGNSKGVKLSLNGKEISWPSKEVVIHDFIILKPKE